MNGSDNEAHTPRFDALATGLALEKRAIEELCMLGPGDRGGEAAVSAQKILADLTGLKDSRVVAGIFMAVVEDDQGGEAGFRLAGGFIGMPAQIEALEMLVRGRRLQALAKPEATEH